MRMTPPVIAAVRYKYLRNQGEIAGGAGGTAETLFTPFLLTGAAALSNQKEWNGRIRTTLLLRNADGSGGGRFDLAWLDRAAAQGLNGGLEFCQGFLRRTDHE